MLQSVIALLFQWREGRRNSGLPLQMESTWKQNLSKGYEFAESFISALPSS